MPPSSESSGDDSDWCDVEPEEEELQTVFSLFDNSSFKDVPSMLEDCKSRHGFDFLATQRRLGLDFYGSVKLINFIRSRTQDGTSIPTTIMPEDIASDDWLKPVIDNDALILSLDELGVDDDTAQKAEPDSTSSTHRPRSNSQLEHELATLQSQFADYRLAVEQTLEKRWGENSNADDSADTSKAKAAQHDESKYYWESYATHDIHETMLKDTVRTDAYRDFIYNNKTLFKGKVVLDIGCGTGILSMFCAKAGAKAVYAIDNANIIDKARENVNQNALSDVVHCLRGKVEDIDLPVGQVDIIISEWMGYCLLYEAMLPSILHARDKYLKPDGLLVPSHATIWMAPLSVPDFVADHFSFWDDVYGFDMKAMKAGLHEEVRVDVFPPSSLCGTSSRICHLDLHSVQTKELEFCSKYQSTITRDISTLDGFLIWFDIFFTLSRQEMIPNSPSTAVNMTEGPSVAFTTGPLGRDTHWKQGFLSVDSSNGTGALKSNSEIHGEVAFKAPEENPRALNISTSWARPGSEIRCQTWSLT